MRPIARPRPADPVRLDAEAAVVVADAGVPATPHSPGAIASPSTDAATETLPVDPPLAIRTPELDCAATAASGYRRGRKTPISLVRIDGEPIERATAEAYWAMRAAAAADGVELTIFSAFRSHEQQRYFYECFKSCSCNNCSPAAKPGYSNHQMGRAVDIAMWPGVLPWLEANAKRFGFVDPVPSEPWHWELRRGAKPPKQRACPAK